MENYLWGNIWSKVSMGKAVPKINRKQEEVSLIFLICIQWDCLKKKNKSKKLEGNGQEHTTLPNNYFYALSRMRFARGK